MTPQNNIMIVASIAQNCELQLRQLLDGMNVKSGVYNDQNELIAFHWIDTIHFARLVILEDNTREDLLECGKNLPSSTKSLALLCDFDGTVDVFLRQLVAVAARGVVKLFGCCEKGPSEANLISWLEQHEVRASAAYINWVGRTVVQIREEEVLFRNIQMHLDQISQAVSPRELWSRLRDLVEADRNSGNIHLTPEEPTPLSWRVTDALHCIAVPILLLLLSPFLLLALPFFLIQLRMHEKTDPVIAPRPSAEHSHQLAVLEDHVVTNQFSAYGNLKPGPFRRWTITAVFIAIDYTARHIFNRGFLARVVTIHFARWVFLDGHTRAFFASNYDGSLEAYMGDFINKVAWGLNIVFSNGLGYPKTDWLIVRGATQELTFKDYLRRHQLPSQVWYNAAPSLTAYDMERNRRIRAGLEKPWLSDVALQQWISLL
jgi:hypothetical protein